MAAPAPRITEGPKIEALQDPPKGTTETAPRRRGRPPGSKNRTSTSTRSLESQIAATLMAFNLGLMLIPPLQRDALDEIEIHALAKALDQQARTSPRFRKMIEGALAVTSGGQLMGVCVIIGARRAARHGMLPAEADSMFGAMLAAQPPAPSAPTFAPENSNGAG